MRLPLGVVLLVAGAAVGLACGETTTESTFTYPDADVTVFVQDNFFNPPTVTVPVNGTVLFRWAGSNEHNTNFDDASAPPDCPFLNVGYCLRTFSQGGVFGFVCDPHAGGGMFGSVEVTTP